MHPWLTPRSTNHYRTRSKWVPSSSQKCTTQVHSSANWSNLNSRPTTNDPHPICTMTLEDFSQLTSKTRSKRLPIPPRRTDTLSTLNQMAKHLLSSTTWRSRTVWSLSDKALHSKSLKGRARMPCKVRHRDSRRQQMPHSSTHVAPFSNKTT